MIKEFIQEYHPSRRWKSMKKPRRMSSDDEYRQESEEDEEEEEEEEELRRKRIHRMNANHPDPIGQLTKKLRERFARKTLEIEGNPEENTSYQRFQQFLETFYDDFQRYRDEFDDHYLELLLPSSTLEELSELAEKLKLSAYFTSMDRSKLRCLIEVLALRIQQGIEVNPFLEHENIENLPHEQTWRDLIFERLITSANACDVALNIMTTAKISQEILVENAIELSMIFIKSQLNKTIYPEFDPLYRNENQSKGWTKRIC